MARDKYDGITSGDVMSEKELQERNVHIYNNSLIVVPTGNIATDGSPQVKVMWLSEVMQL